MAYISIIGRKDSIKVDNKDARIIKKIWLGDDKTPRADKDRDLDLGDVWAGKYGQIRNIEIESDYKKTDTSQVLPELTEEQRKINAHRMKIIKVNLKRMSEGLEPLPFTAVLDTIN